MKCKYPNCDAEATVAGFCGKHYTRNQRAQVARIQVRNERAALPPLEKWSAVYVIGCQEFLPVKVGRSKDILRRITTMQTGCPYQLKLYGAAFGPRDTITWLEKLVHDKLEEFDLRTREDFAHEWFDVSPEDAVAVVRKCVELENLPVLDWPDYLRRAKLVGASGGVNWFKKINALDFMVSGISGGASGV